MREKVYKTKISDIRLETILFDEAFHLKISDGVTGVMSRIKHIHQHSTYEIFFVLEGTLNVHDPHERCFHSKKAVIIPPCYDHYTVSNVKNGYCFYFSIEQLANTDEKLFERVCQKLSTGITSFEIHEDSVFYITRFAESVYAGESDEKISHLLYLMFETLFESTNTSNEKLKNIPNKYSKYIHIIELYINNCESKMNLKELSDRLYLCPKQVSRIIQKEYKCSLSEIVNRRKLTMACALLKHTNLTVGQIASTVGYEYENYFFTLFKKSFGITPLQYRKENEKD